MKCQDYKIFVILKQWYICWMNFLILFQYACLARCNLSGANLSHCCLERADLSHANLEGAQLLGVKALCANMEGRAIFICETWNTCHFSLGIKSWRKRERGIKLFLQPQTYVMATFLGYNVVSSPFGHITEGNLTSGRNWIFKYYEF